MSPIAIRLLREFWLPFLVASIWTAFNVRTTWPDVPLKDLVNVFGPTFFLSSWLLGQFFRVQKQVRTDQSLDSIESRVGAVLSGLEEQARKFSGHMNGLGKMDIFPLFHSMTLLTIAIKNRGEFPLHDVVVEVIDLDEPINPEQGKFWTRHQFRMESLHPTYLAELWNMNCDGRSLVRLGPVNTNCDD